MCKLFVKYYINIRDKMRSVIVFLVFIVFIKACNTIRCYKCEAEKSNYVLEQDTEMLCQYFNGNDSYVVDCPDSTMCVQDHITLDMRNGFKSDVTKRYCAHQTEKGAQLYIDGVGWKPVKPIHEVYEEGCSIMNNYGEKMTNTRTCYCRGDLCNGATGGTACAVMWDSAISMSVVLNVLAAIAYR